VGFICIFFLALFLHFREVRIEVLELNATAAKYVVAQIDFEFPDYEATIVLRQQAMKDVGDIYQIDEKQIREVRLLLEEDLIHNKEWRNRASTSTFEQMYKAADQLETYLLETRFADPRTIQKVKDLHLSEDPYFEFIPSNATQLLPHEFWQKTTRILVQNDGFQKETVSYVVDAFHNQSWHLIQDMALERRLRSQISLAIPDKIAQVVAGTRIIDQGEIVTSRHLLMMQAMKQALSDSRKLWDPATIIASFLLSIIFVTISGLYFRISQPTFIRSLREISLFVCIVLLTLLFAKFIEYILLKSTSDVIEAVRYPIVAPFATILICILLSPKTALFAATFLSILLSVSLAVDYGHFLILNLVTSIVVIISSRALRKRKEVFTVCMKSWLSSIPVLYAYSLAENRLVSDALVYDIAASFVFLLIIAILVVGILPALETLFGVLTEMTLMEYMDSGTELLRRFALACPGTYQHSLVLGTLAETCAQAINANGLFCRAATLYHDIGKMNNPQFYTENQQGQMNIHQLLTPLESAQVIISHVSDGATIANKERLPQSFIDIILEHHGTTMVYYFYRKQLELKGGRKEEVDEKQFRYPGPRPRSKESGIIMICDSIEAATRSLEEINEETLSELVNRLVVEKAEDGQFDQCQLTFEELSAVKKTLVKTLLLSHHVRVKYPKKEKPEPC
ncbi:MAG TPA: HDIG domain-containing protein, partial [Bdellovibrionota bacterium]|nr:HDIG domain-containing protein [Bdellovibrionota bacterium]